MARVRGRAAAVAGADRATGAAPAKKCGRRTRRCHCKHHRNEHADKAGACSQCDCQAFSPRPCSQPALPNGACRFHGGKSLAGVASGTFKHGGRSRYMQYLNGRMASTYEAAARDPELLSLTAELALVEARIADTLMRFEHDVSADRWKDVASAFADFERAGKAGDVKAATAAAATVRELIATGQREGNLGAELSELIDLKRRCAEGQARILRDTHQMVALHRVMEIFAQVADTVRRNVTDPRQVSAVVTDLSRLLGTGADSAAGAGERREPD